MRWGTKLGVDMALKDSLWEVLQDKYIGGVPMAITAENLASEPDRAPRALYHTCLCTHICELFS
jgi:hypothetical protein